MKCLSCKMEEMQEATNPYFVKPSNCYVIIENVPCYNVVNVVKFIIKLLCWKK